MPAVMRDQPETTANVGQNAANTRLSRLNRPAAGLIAPAIWRNFPTATLRGTELGRDGDEKRATTLQPHFLPVVAQLAA